MKTKYSNGMKRQVATPEIEVEHEEIITHSYASQDRRGGWKGEARIMGIARINGEPHNFETVVPIHWQPVIAELSDRPGGGNSKERA